MAYCMLGVLGQGYSDELIKRKFPSPGRSSSSWRKTEINQMGKNVWTIGIGAWGESLLGWESIAFHRGSGKESL